MYSFIIGERNIAGKEAFLLICAEDTDNHSYDGVLRSYELITDYCKWHDRGKLTVTGVSGKGEILNTDALQKAKKWDNPYRAMTQQARLFSRRVRPSRFFVPPRECIWMNG